MQTTDLIDRIKQLPSVFHVSEATTDFAQSEYTVMVAYLNEKSLIENEEALYEVPRVLKEFDIEPILRTDEFSTSWEWIL